MTNQPHDLLLAYYGDDFTGSTDALEFLSRAGARTVLFLEPPQPEQLARYEGLQAIGVAGMTRAMAPDQMEETLRPAFEALQKLGVAHVHYKVCSTFDSSPTTGSIGRAMETGAAVFKASYIPLVVAAPALGRYCAFGNLFARMGIGSQGSIYRLDRHPSMRCHPVTPADESDLRLHLARQTDLQVGLLDILQIERPVDESLQALQQLVADGAEVVLFDGLYAEQLTKIGYLLEATATPGTTTFSVGSSGIEMALGSYWTQQGQLQPPPAWPSPAVAEPLLVASGSCSPVTSGQLAWALAHGFAEIALDTAAIAEAADAGADLDTYVAAAVSHVKEGRSVIIHTSRGSDDARIAKSAEILAGKGTETQTSKVFGTALGKIVREVLAQTIAVRRIVLAGGDTSSFAARALGIEAVEMMAPLAPGAPLCKAHAPGSPVDGLEVTFKGGQVGREDYFGMVAGGVAY